MSSARTGVRRADRLRWSCGRDHHHRYHHQPAGVSPAGERQTLDPAALHLKSVHPVTAPSRTLLVAAVTPGTLRVELRSQAECDEGGSLRSQGQLVWSLKKAMPISFPAGVTPLMQTSAGPVTPRLSIRSSVSLRIGPGRS